MSQGDITIDLAGGNAHIDYRRLRTLRESSCSCCTALRLEYILQQTWQARLEDFELRTHPWIILLDNGLRVGCGDDRNDLESLHNIRLGLVRCDLPFNEPLEHGHATEGDVQMREEGEKVDGE